MPRSSRYPTLATVGRVLSALTMAATCMCRAENAVAEGEDPLEIEVHGDDQMIETRDSVARLALGDERILFKVGALPQFFNANARRVRFRLEGVDTDWSEREGTMVFGVRAYDGQGRPVANETFVAKRKSPGWGTSPQDSRFTHRRELIVLPGNAATLEVYFASAGAPTVFGVYFVTNLRLSRIDADGHVSTVLYDSTEALSEASTDPAQPGVPGWKQEGTKPSMATVANAGSEGVPLNAFCLRDDSPVFHAEWHLSNEARVPVTAGERLLLEWNEAYSIGDANYFAWSYDAPRPGTYQLDVEALDTFGNPTGKTNSVRVVVPLPPWRQPWIWAAVAAGIIGVGGLTYRKVSQARTRKHLAALRRRHALDEERLRIARDLHDNLGARLTHIALASGQALRKTRSDPERQNFERISGMTRDLVFYLYETVWAVNPKNDTLEELISYLCQLTENLAKPSGLRCRLNIGMITEDTPVSSEVRHHLALALREAVQNAVRYSNGTEINLQITFTSPRLAVTLMDDGIGFDADAPSESVLAIKRRIEAIKGTVFIASRPQNGTTIRIEIPIVTPANAAPSSDSHRNAPNSASHDS